LSPHRSFPLSPPASRLTAAVLVSLGLLLAAGCGLGDYEKRMDVERARLIEFDKENLLLGKPLKMPVNLDPKEGKIEEQPALLRIKVFLRPPKGVNSACADKDAKKSDQPANPSGVPLFRYAWGEGSNVFLAGAIGMPSAQFQREVCEGLAAFHAAKYKRPLPTSDPPATDKNKDRALALKPLDSRSGQLPPIRYQTQTLEEPKFDPKEAAERFRYQIYYHQSGKNQVAVVYQLPLNAAEQTGVGPAINLSLKTLGVGPKNAAAQEKAYVERLAYFPSKKG
jgi:hypothetical protein